MRRKIEFAIGEHYHIRNRGVEKRTIFTKDKDFLRFLESIIYFNTEKPSWIVKDVRESGINAIPKPEERLVDVIAYCLNSNHFHLILKENKKNGIATFMKKISTGYAMYFNKKYNHSGVLFQGRFKAVHIGSNEQLLHASAYVNCNCEIHNFAKSENYQWTSFLEYIKNIDESLCQKEVVLDQFKNKEEYRKYALNQIARMQEIKEIDGTNFE